MHTFTVQNYVTNERIMLISILNANAFTGCCAHVGGTYVCTYVRTYVGNETTCNYVRTCCTVNKWSSLVWQVTLVTTGT